MRLLQQPFSALFPGWMGGEPQTLQPAGDMRRMPDDRGVPAGNPLPGRFDYPYGDFPLGGGKGPGPFPPAPGIAGPSAPAEQPQSFMDRFQSFREANPGVLAQLGIGMMTGNGAGGMSGASDLMQNARAKAATAKYLLQKGIAKDADEAQMLAGNGELLKLAMGGADSTKLTDDMREYNQAVRQGFTGTFMDYQVKMKEAGRNQVNIDTGVKLPNGFRWKDPNNQDAGVEPIPGGPGEQVPGELAARLGLAESFLGQLPTIRQKVKEGLATGAWDHTKAIAGYGAEGEVYRQIESGADALQRMLTGAGMPASEADDYARRYRPTYMDTPESVGSKLDQLERELNHQMDMAMRGRGGNKAAGEGWTDLGNGVRIRKKQ